MQRASCGELEPAASVDSTDFCRESLSATLSRRQLAITLFLEETSGERGECVKSDSTGSAKLKHLGWALESTSMDKGYTYACCHPPLHITCGLGEENVQS